jgi:hypothetical protein
MPPTDRRTESNIHVEKLELGPQPDTLISEDEILVFWPAIFANPRH